MRHGRQVGGGRIFKEDTTTTLTDDRTTRLVKVVATGLTKLTTVWVIERVPAVQQAELVQGGR